MAERSFAATISEWGQNELGAAEATLRLASQMVLNQVTTTDNEGGKLPFEDGNLRNSIIASSEAMPTVKPGQKEFPDVSGSSLEILGSSELGSVSYIGVQAEYGARMNYGFVGQDSLGRTYNQTGFGFLDAEEQAWPQTVAKAEAQIRTRFEGGSGKA